MQLRHSTTVSPTLKRASGGCQHAAPHPSADSSHFHPLPQAIKLCQGGLMFNADATFTGMLRTGPLMEVAAEMLELRGPLPQALTPDLIRRLKKAVLGVRVRNGVVMLLHWEGYLHWALRP